MAFALSPDDGPPRLIRFTELERPLVATLDRENNVLCIDRKRYDELTEPMQEIVLRTHETELLLDAIPRIRNETPVLRVALPRR